MKLWLEKFGTTLVSRPAGKEALLAFQLILENIGAQENIEIDFGGVLTLTPGWGDEFLSPLLAKYGARLILANTGNLSVKATLEMLEKINQKTFKRQ